MTIDCNNCVRNYTLVRHIMYDYMTIYVCNNHTHHWCVRTDKHDQAMLFSLCHMHPFAMPISKCVRHVRFRNRKTKSNVQKAVVPGSSCHQRQRFVIYAMNRTATRNSSQWIANIQKHLFIYQHQNKYEILYGYVIWFGMICGHIAVCLINA